MHIECKCKVEKFIRLHHDVFAWGDDVEPKVWDRIYDALEELEAEEE
jgi:hypothetical protein